MFLPSLFGCGIVSSLVLIVYLWLVPVYLDVVNRCMMRKDMFKSI